MPDSVSMNAGRAATLARDVMGAQVRLYVNNVNGGTGPQPDDLIGEYTQCTLAGYAPVTPEWDAPVPGNPDSTIATAGPVMFEGFTASGQTAYGWYLVDADGVLQAARAFAAPQPLTSEARIEIASITRKLR